MELKIARDVFLEGLSKTQGVVERKNTMPVLSNVLLDADKTGLKISATDLEVAVVVQVQAQVSTPGRITVPSKHLTDIVRELSASEIKILLKENDRLEIKAGSSVFNIPGLSAKEFPTLPKVENKSTEVDCARFKLMIEKTAPAMSLDDTRQNLAGIYMKSLEGGRFCMVATDGHRLCKTEQSLNIDSDKSFAVIVPRKGVAELRKIVSQEGSFELAIGEKNLFARKGNETLFVRLIEGEFPDYERVIPQKNDKMVMVPREPFMGALRRVSLLSSERSRAVVISFTPGHLDVFIDNPDLGEAREELDVEYKGEKMNVGFNAKYFLDILTVMNDEKLILALQSDLAPCMIKSEKDFGFLAVIMPMRI